MDLLFTFHAEHAVVMPDGQEPRHEHDWHVRLKLAQELNCSQLRQRLEKEISAFEGQYLNAMPELKPYGASAESLARLIYQRCKPVAKSAGNSLLLAEVEEELGCWARYWQEEKED